MARIRHHGFSYCARNECEGKSPAKCSQLQAELDIKTKALKKIIIESGKVDINNWPCQQQICQAIARQGLKGRKE